MSSKRLQKAETEVISERIRQMFPNHRNRVHVGPKGVWAYTDDGQPFVGFTWVKNQGWKLWFTTMCYIHDDLTSFLDEVKTLVSITDEMNSAWKSYKKSRSQKNWQIYQGTVATVMGRDVVVLT